MKGSHSIRVTTLSSFILPPSSLPSPEVLPELLRAERADAVQAEAEDDAVLFAQTDVVEEVLDGDVAAVPGVADGEGRRDERALLAGPVLEVEKDAGSAEEALVGRAEEDRRAPLRALQGAGLLARRVREARQRRGERDGARVVEGGEGFDEVAARHVAEADGEVAHAERGDIQIG